MASLEGGLILLIVGIALVFISREIQVEPLINKLLYIGGILSAIIGLIVLVIALVGLAI